MKKILLVSFRIYKKLLSPILVSIFGGGCRYSPTCSEYAYEAVNKHGAKKGSVLALKRFLRCHPFSKGYLDPVPN